MPQGTQAHLFSQSYIQIFFWPNVQNLEKNQRKVMFYQRSREYKHILIFKLSVVWNLSAHISNTNYWYIACLMLFAFYASPASQLEFSLYRATILSHTTLCPWCLKIMTTNLQWVREEVPLGQEQWAGSY